MCHHSCQPNQTDPPVFLVGAERSGTTLLRLMLDHHPRIAFQYESEYMVQFVGDDGTLPDPNAVLRRLRTDRVFLSSGLDSDPSRGYLGLVHDWLEQKRRRDGKPLVGATVHTHFDRLRFLWPDARYIHLLRDGRDVARSCVAMGWYGNTFAAADHWLQAHRCWDVLCRNTPPARRIEVRYEQLIADTDQTLTGICDFLGTPFDPAMYQYAKRSAYDKPDPTRVFQWKRKMSDRELGLVEGKLGGALRRFGYELSGRPVIEPAPTEARRLYRQSAWGRRRFAVKRFGLGLFLTESLARRLHLGPLHDWTRRRMNAIELQHLK